MSAAGPAGGRRGGAARPRAGPGSGSPPGGVAVRGGAGPGRAGRR